MLEVKSIYLNRNKKQILSNFNLILKKKTMVLLLGENGAGKSSLLDTIVGLIKPQSGEVLFDGQTLEEIETQKKKYFTYIPHEICLRDSFSIAENIDIWLNLHSIKLNTKQISKKLEVFDLQRIKDQLVRNLSHGQKKKVSLTKLLFSNTKLWIMDEPINGLDKKSVQTFNSICTQHIKEGGSVLFTSHIYPKFKITKKVLLKKFCNKKLYKNSFDSWGKL